MSSADSVGKDMGVIELEGSEDKAMAWELSDPGFSHWDCVSGYRPDLLDATYNLALMGIIWSLATNVVQYVGDQTGTHHLQSVKGVSSAQHSLHTVYQGPTASLQMEVDEQYEEMSFHISSKFNSTSSVTTTYITSNKGALFGEDGNPYHLKCFDVNYFWNNSVILPLNGHRLIVASFCDMCGAWWFHGSLFLL